MVVEAETVMAIVPLDDGVDLCPVAGFDTIPHRHDCNIENHSYLSIVVYNVDECVIFMRCIIVCLLADFYHSAKVCETSGTIRYQVR